MSLTVHNQRQDAKQAPPSSPNRTVWPNAISLQKPFVYGNKIAPNKSPWNCCKCVCVCGSNTGKCSTHRLETRHIRAPCLSCGLCARALLFSFIVVVVDLLPLFATVLSRFNCQLKSIKPFLAFNWIRHQFPNFLSYSFIISPPACAMFFHFVFLVRVSSRVDFPKSFLWFIRSLRIVLFLMSTFSFAFISPIGSHFLGKKLSTTCTFKSVVVFYLQRTLWGPPPQLICQLDQGSVQFIYDLLASVFSNCRTTQSCLRLLLSKDWIC